MLQIPVYSGTLYNINYVIMFFCCYCFCFYQALHTVSNVGQFYTVPKEISKKVLSPFLTKKFKSQVQYLEVNGNHDNSMSSD